MNLFKNLFEIDKVNEYKLFYNSFKNNNLSDLKYQNQKNIHLFKFNYPNKVLNFSQKFFKYPKIDGMLKGIDLFFEPNILFNAVSNSCKNVITFHDLSFEILPQYYSAKRKIWHKLVNLKN